MCCIESGVCLRSSMMVLFLKLCTMHLDIVWKMATYIIKIAQGDILLYWLVKMIGV